MSIKSSTILAGILFATVFTAFQKVPAQGTGNTPQPTATETEVIPKPTHRPHLIRELLYQVNEVNRKLQAGVVIQCRCNNDWWWTPANDSAGDGDSQRHWSVIPEYKKIVRGYGYNMKEAKWNAMQACGPIAIAVPIEEENPPEVGPKAENGNTAKIDDIMDDDSIMDKAFMWCHYSKRFRP